MICEYWAPLFKSNGFKKLSESRRAFKEQVRKVSTINRKDLMSSKIYWVFQGKLPLAIMFHQKLCSMSKIITENWGILQVNPVLQKVFREKPIIN